jgi:glycosyltransferase involved in cell wall biosynthesis
MVTSVCGPNAGVQHAAGADRDRLRVIPNPVAVAPAASACREPGPFRAGLVGRVVEIKDVETFLRACALVAAQVPAAEFAVVGPTDHEPEYAERCVTLADELGIAVTFTGTTDPAPWYDRLDAVVLTSLSEAQPLVLLEAMAAGVPVVSTDVGGCRELVGDAGLLTPARAPQATAGAMLRLAGDDALRSALALAGRRRVAARHAPTRIYGAYHELYERLAA